MNIISNLSLMEMQIHRKVLLYKSISLAVWSNNNSVEGGSELRMFDCFGCYLEIDLEKGARYKSRETCS